MTINQFITKNEQLLDTRPLDTRALCQAILNDLNESDYLDFISLLLDLNIDPLKWLRVQYSDVRCFNRDYTALNFDDYLIENAFIILDRDFYSQYGMVSLATVLDENKTGLNLRSNRYSMSPESFNGTKFEDGFIAIYREDSRCPACSIVLRLKATDQTVYELEQTISRDALKYIPGIGFGLNLDKLQKQMSDLDNNLKQFIKASLIA